MFMKYRYTETLQRQIKSILEIIKASEKGKTVK